MTACEGCGAEANVGYLCTECRYALIDTYQALPAALEDLMATAYRQDKVSGPGGKVGKGHARPLPYKLAAADLLHETTAELLTLYQGPDTTSYTRLCYALIALLPSNVLQPGIGTHLARLRVNLDRIRVLTDLPQAVRYLGPCDLCSATVTATADEDSVECPGPDCGNWYDVAMRVDELIDRARNLTADTATLTQALSTLVTPLSEQDLWNWKARGKLVPVNVAGRTPYYRVGDVVDLLVARLRKAQHNSERTA